MSYWSQVALIVLTFVAGYLTIRVGSYAIDGHEVEPCINIIETVEDAARDVDKADGFRDASEK
jgi:hypothetical protein